MASEEALKKFSSAPTQNMELESLVTAACSSFRLIEPWNKASSDHPSVQPIIEAVRDQGVVYYKALDSSIGVVEEGYAFCANAEDLCEYLMDHSQSHTVQDLQEYIGDMRSMAQQAHQSATETVGMFRSVREHLLEIHKLAPEEVEKLAEEKQSLWRRLGAADKKRKQAGKNIRIARAIVFPALLPVFNKKFDKLEMKHTKMARDEVERRVQEVKTCEEGMALLQNAANDLAELIKHVDAFSDWWLEMDTMLYAVETKVGELHANHLVALRLTSARRTWTQVKDRYQDYKVKMCKLQDYYPSSRNAITAS